MLVTLIGISIIIFVLLRVVPGNIVDILFDAAGFVDPTDKANLEKELGLNLPIYVQYLNWIGGLLHGDLGYSYVSEKPALQEILPRIPITARLAALALLFSASIGIPLGVISAVHQGSRLDYTLRVVSLSGLSLPSFWLGLLILMASVSLFGGLIVTETVFNIPGVARFLVEALRWRDYPIVQNLVMLIAVVVVVANFTVDMLYAAIDPRIRYGD